MLKPIIKVLNIRLYTLAAFRRLCVETSWAYGKEAVIAPAAFRRLCVETIPQISRQRRHRTQPPSGGCVLKHAQAARSHGIAPQPPSGGCVLKQVSQDFMRPDNTPAAFRRLCVETNITINDENLNQSSRLQAAVC